MKYRVTVDIDQADGSITDWANENTDTYRSGVWGVDELGVYHIYYGTRNTMVEFVNPEELK